PTTLPAACTPVAADKVCQDKHSTEPHNQWKNELRQKLLNDRSHVAPHPFSFLGYPSRYSSSSIAGLPARNPNGPVGNAAKLGVPDSPSDASTGGSLKRLS